MSEKGSGSPVPGVGMLAGLPVAAYTIDAEGRISSYNEAAAVLWGFRPRLGSADWHREWRLFRPDGQPLRHEEAGLAGPAGAGQGAESGEIIAERSDGTRVVFIAHSGPLRNAHGATVGRVHVLTDISRHTQPRTTSALLASIVASSDDAIISKTPQGIITSWNAGATRILGYEAQEMIGQSIRRIVPPDRQSEEDEILERLARGERIDHFETVRLAKDGRLVEMSVTISPIRDSLGMLIGASKVGRDIGRQKEAERELARLAAIVSSSDDAIIGERLDGTITSWNPGATRLFGYQADEMVGRSIGLIIPSDLHEQEEDVLARLRSGEHVEHFDTERLTKDGRRIPVSLTVSPIRDSAGRIIGASRIAADITQRKQGEELQRLLFNELNHRVKNTLATVQAIASQSMRRAASPDHFVQSFNGRVQALARAHDLIVNGKMKGASVGEIVREQVVLGPAEGARVSYSGPSVMLDARVAVQLSLVLHELATNARKYGALSEHGGQLAIGWSIDLGDERRLELLWRETGVADVKAPRRRGFGTTLIERSLLANRGEAHFRYGADGLSCDIILPLPEAVPAIEPSDRPPDEPMDVPGRAIPLPVDRLRGKRILVVEDEPLLAMEMESDLAAAGFAVVGPVPDAERALRLIAESPPDAALVDANLAGVPADDLARILIDKAIPFAFATGFGREAMAPEFSDVPMLIKPFAGEQMIAQVRALLGRPKGPPSEVVRLRARRR